MGHLNHAYCICKSLDHSSSDQFCSASYCDISCLWDSAYLWLGYNRYLIDIHLMYDRWVNEWKDIRWMDGWMDGWMEGEIVLLYLDIVINISCSSPISPALNWFFHYILPQRIMLLLYFYSIWTSPSIILYS